MNSLDEVKIENGLIDIPNLITVEGEIPFNHFHRDVWNDTGDPTSESINAIIDQEFQDVIEDSSIDQIMKDGINQMGEEAFKNIIGDLKDLK